jgi:hypothetical protein
MPTKKIKGELLTSRLDFEGMDDFSSSAGEWADLDTSPVSIQTDKPNSVVERRADQMTSKKPTSPSVRRTDGAMRPPERFRPAEKKPAANARKQDRFALYATIVVLLGLATASYIIYETKFSNLNSAGLSYKELPQSLIIKDGLVAQMQATIQVDDEDAAWLNENIDALDGGFKKAANALDLEVLRHPENLPKVQMELKKRINNDLKTGKVQAVLLTQFLIQEQTE